MAQFKNQTALLVILNDQMMFNGIRQDHRDAAIRRLASAMRDFTIIKNDD